MKPFTPPVPPFARASYVACRHGGAPPRIAAVELALPAETAARLERLFRARPGGGPDPMKPRFARHAAHVRAALAQGGFPSLPERRR